MITNGTSVRYRVNIPLYTFSDADHLANATRGTAKRWLSGYTYRNASGLYTQQPPISPDDFEREAVSFADLVEIVAISGLKRSGFSIKRIRGFVETCQEFFGIEHPLTTLRFKTDGREFYVDQGEALLEVGRRKGNRAWAQVLGPFLDSLDYAEEVANRWWPLGRTTPVIVDPEYAYGFPVLYGSGIRTEIVLERFQAGDLDDQIASDFKITTIDVQRALQFELKRAAA